MPPDRIHAHGQVHGGEPMAPQQGGHPLHVRHHPQVLAAARIEVDPLRRRRWPRLGVGENLGRKPVRRREDPGLAEHLRVAADGET